MLATMTCQKLLSLCITLTVLFCLCQARDGDDVVAYISEGDIKGSFHFEQYNSTIVKITIKLSYDGVDNKLYRIHQHPSNYQQKCKHLGERIFDMDSIKGHLGKEETLYVDANKISLHGKNSIQGRSISVALSSNTSKILACGTLVSKGIENSYAVASISNSKIAGKFEFVQQGLNGDTMITGEISHSDRSTVATDNHKWYILGSTEPEEWVANCQTHMNWTQVFDSDRMSQSGCNSTDAKTCAIGDLTGKHGTLDVGVAGDKKLTVIDSNLPLFGEGDNNVKQHVFVILEQGSNDKVLGCGIIKPKGPFKAVSTFVADKNSGVSGTVEFEQISPYHRTYFVVNLKGLDERAKGYHVHKFPISDSSNPCSGASVGGHLNPWGINPSNSPKPGTGPMDKYEAGDLSGKFGNLANKTDYELKIYDENLPMFGHHALVGRSIVIHNNDASNSRMTCANIIPHQGVKIESWTNFTKQSDLFDGYVQLVQYVLPNGIVTPTMYIIDVVYQDNPTSRKTLKHNFHVHVKPLGNDTQANGTCMSVGGHYNPNSVDVGNDVYKEQCDQDHPYRCEVGDTSAKVGTYDVGYGKRFYCDEDSPLYGPHTVLGRSIVFHAKEMGAPRLACADVVPVEGSMVKKHTVEGSKKIVDSNRGASMVDILLEKFGLPQSEDWRFGYPRLEDGSNNKECYSFSFYMLDSKF
eukprot:TCONS_00002850-protein